jgi:hypothetical protein
MVDRVEKSAAFREATVEKTPVNNNDVANKLYVDSVSAADLENVASHIIPQIDETYDLGSQEKKWSNIYAYVAFLTTMLVIGGIAIYYDASNGRLVINNSMLVNGSIEAVDNITAQFYYGDGSLLTGIAAAISNCNSTGSCAAGQVVYNDSSIVYDINISWNSLTEIPEGFADGTDDGAGGSADTNTNVTEVQVSGTSTKYLSIVQDGQSNITESWTDYDTDTTCDSGSCDIANTGTLDGYEAAALLDDTNTNTNVTDIQFTGGSTKTLTIEQGNGDPANLTASFVDWDTTYTNASWNTAAIPGNVSCDRVNGSTSNLCSLVDTDTTYTNASFNIEQIPGRVTHNATTNLTLQDNYYICLGSSGCDDSYIVFNSTTLIIKVN